eukprot:CAMPEP_0194735040 /NCGR_PEP_ID=MMETSP0296-20130528/71974_1 /TAXON_ID=39354 /ORGANISM="Heterosigma akashiwo, Strain CCMP2393" /LENGTH=75 /DNA_ID=CAMNT_0039644071 /DNA_START=53 /DNA_END=275 /DNA_ORIENTATION=-
MMPNSFVNHFSNFSSCQTNLRLKKPDLGQDLALEAQVEEERVPEEGLPAGLPAQAQPADEQVGIRPQAALQAGAA